ncbi:hypothetical protein [Massilia cavernae]|uniref:Peptidase M48 domain-containing protein n=1 Tax=Massilia cavernae TaxID=2320864 RepID=A0A418XQ12_9BURK|nr:hypothetical protein [Massilia cavernae]RJG14560.1 hypothetical protein D3872_17450 [Massilia cavernae]
MNKILRNALAALCLAAAGANACAAVATEEQWIAAARHAVEFGRAHGLVIDLEVMSGTGLSPGHTPIGVWNENGRCTLVVSARDNPTAVKLTEMIAPELLELFLQGAAMHEVGHCYRRLNGYPHNEKLLPAVAWIAPVQSWFARRVRTEEVFADMTEVAWLARYHPERFDAMVEQIQRVRRRFLKPRHDTLAWLEAARADGALDADGNVFQLAERRMSRYR